MPEPGTIQHRLAKHHKVVVSQGLTLRFGQLGHALLQVNGHNASALAGQVPQRPTQTMARRTQPGQRQTRQQAQNNDDQIQHG
jgi:enamine deaminase RidA (YjgF/YER057c/UK114 family)